MGSLTSAVQSVNQMAQQPFKMRLPLTHLGLIFLLLLLVSFQWRLILDKIEEV